MPRFRMHGIAAGFLASCTIVLELGLPTGASATIPGPSTDHKRSMHSCGMHGASTTSSDLNQWFLYGPYWVAGFYIGGAWSTNSSCFNPPSATFISNVRNQGWDLDPIWDGKQSQCSGLSIDLFSNDPTTAYNQGQTAGSNATQTLSSLGFPTGSYVYLDVEDFDAPGRPATAACITAAQNYVNGFDFAVNFNGYKYGLYAAECAPDIDWAWSIQGLPPTDIWYANISTPKEPTDSNLQCMAATHWTGPHRIHHYSDNVSETYPTTGANQVTMLIDRDCVNGRVDGGHAWTGGC